MVSNPRRWAFGGARAGIPTTISFLTANAAERVRSEQGPAKVVTATNVFAHIEDVHAVVANIRRLMADDGTFISESHYLLSLVETLQYDTIYHEHLRYYSLTSVENLLRGTDSKSSSQSEFRRTVVQFASTRRQRGSVQSTRSSPKLRDRSRPFRWTP